MTGGSVWCRVMDIEEEGGKDASNSRNENAVQDYGGHTV